MLEKEKNKIKRIIILIRNNHKIIIFISKILCNNLNIFFCNIKIIITKH